MQGSWFTRAVFGACARELHVRCCLIEAQTQLAFTKSNTVEGVVIDACSRSELCMTRASAWGAKGTAHSGFTWRGWSGQTVGLAEESRRDLKSQVTVQSPPTCIVINTATLTGLRPACSLTPSNSSTNCPSFPFHYPQPPSSE